MSYFFPFAQNPLGAIPQTITYDLVIQEPYPGISLYPTNIAGSAYSEIREVNGCLWLVVNALWNPNTLQWEQDTPCNSAQPAYAIELCEDGTFKRNVAPATGAINTPVAWTTVFTWDANGLETAAPLTLTQQTQIAQTLNLTWNAGAAAVMVAREVNVTDTSSAPESALDQLSVGGTAVWKVRKDGTLEIGKVPASAIVGGIVQSLLQGTGVQVTNNGNDTWTIALAHGDYVDVANAQTVTGQKAFQGPVVLQALANGAIGGTNGLWQANGAIYSGGQWIAEAVTATIVIVSSTGFSLYYNSGLVVGNTFAPTLIFHIDNTGKIVTSQPIDASLIQNDFEQAGGIVVSYDAGTDKIKVDGTALVETIASADGSITPTRTGQSVDLAIAAGAKGTSLATIQTFSAPAALPVTADLGVLPGAATANYFIEAIVTGFDWSAAGGTVTLQGSGGSWSNSSSSQQTYYSRTLYIAGTAHGGDHVTAVFSGSFGQMAPGNGIGVVTLKAIRTS